MSDKTQKFCDMSLHSCNNGSNGISFNSLGTWAGGLGLLWAWVVHESFGYLAYWWRTIFYDCCIFDIYEIKKHSQVKVIHGSTTDSISSCFLIHYLHYIKLGGVRTKNRCFGCWTLFSSHYVRCFTYTINICCQKESRLVAVPFLANDVFRIMKITLTLRHFLIFVQFQYLFSIWRYCFHGVNSILKKYFNECWAVKKSCQKARCNKFLSLFLTVASLYFPLSYPSIIHRSVNLILVMTLHSIQ